MPDWTKSMQQTFEYYEVDPNTWRDLKPINSIIDSRIDIDSGAETLGSASFTTSEMLGECYIRVYLITIQNGIREKFPLGTYMAQTPSYSFNGVAKNVTIDAYTPLIELKEKVPPIGYFTIKDVNVLDETYKLIRNNLRAPIVKNNSEDLVPYEFVSDPSDTWLKYINDFITLSNHYLNLDEMGRVLFEPKRKTAALAPTWIYTDDNSSILQPAMTLDSDLYGIPNVVEAIYSNGEVFIHVRVENKEPDSITSIQSRGREIVHRVTNPEISGTPSKEKVQKYAEDLLDEMSSLVYTISYTHGYCPVKVGDCVMLDYRRAGLKNVKARVISQSISCIPGTPVEEKAIFTNNLWR